MLKKLIMKVLTSLSAEEKDALRKALKEKDKLDENVGEAEAVGKESDKAKENRKQDEEEAANAADKAADVAEEIETLAKDDAGKDGETESNEVDDGTDETAADAAEAETQQTAAVPPESGQVSQTENYGNGIRVEDLVTKEQLTERLAALDAKYEAVIAENEALKKKYEDPDFGTYTKKGVGKPDTDKVDYQSFDEYSKQFI